MEKFGIFELLDALSALTALPPEEEGAPPKTDSAYLPPNYPTFGSQEEQRSTPSAQKNADPAAEPPKSPRPDQDALAGFYARHDAVAKKAGKK